MKLYVINRICTFKCSLVYSIGIVYEDFNARWMYYVAGIPCEFDEREKKKIVDVLLGK